MPKGGPNSSDFMQNWLTQEIRSPLFNYWKFQDYDKGTPESCRMHCNLMNDEECQFLKLLKLKYRKGEQIIQTFCRISYPQEIKSPFFNLYKFKNPEKSAPESCGMY